MATVDDTMAWNGSTPAPERPPGPSDKMHRIHEVRLEQGVSLRTASRQLRRDMATVRRQEDESADLRISELKAWQALLQVPLKDLLEDPGASLSAPVMDRARLVRLMKTAASIRELAESKRVGRLATMLIEQLVEIMPELEDVSAWHSVGQRRSLDEMGRAVERCLSDDWFRGYNNADD